MGLDEDAVRSLDGYVASGRGNGASELDRYFQAVWCDLLEVERVGRNDSFFALGGSSLDAVSLQLQVLRDHGIELPLHLIYRNPRYGDLLSEFERRALRASEGKTATTRMGEERAEASLRSHRSVPSLSEPPVRGLWADCRLPTPTPPGIRPATDAERELYILHRRRPLSTAYVETFAFKLTGRLDISRFRLCLDALVERHDSLRTTVTEPSDAPGEPVAVVHRTLPIDWREVNLPGGWSERATEEPPEEMLPHLRQPLDLEHGPLVRVVVGHGESESRLVALQIHHVAIDEWSVRILFEELGRLDRYAASLTDLTVVRPESLPHLANLEELDQGGSPRGPGKADTNALVERSLDWWGERLSGHRAPIPFLRDGSGRSMEPPSQAGWYRFDLTLAVVELLNSVALAHETTPNTVFLAVYAALLERATGRSPLVVGVPLSIRDEPRLEKVVGMFVNVLPVVIEVSATDSLDCLVTRVRRELGEAFERGSVAYWRIVKRLGWSQLAGHDPILQTVFIHRDQPLPVPELWGVEVAALRWVVNAPKFELTLQLENAGENWQGVFEYDPALFSHMQIALLADRFGSLLSEALENPSEPLACLERMAPGERECVIEFERGGSRAIAASTIHGTFRQVAGERAEGVAVSLGDQSITYRELDRWSDDLAAQLEFAGVRPRDVVSVELPRSLGFVAAVLGCLKAGAAYMPLDPADPAERLALLRNLVHPAAIITTGDVSGELGKPVVRGGRGPWDSAGPDGLPRAEPSGPEDPAYVMFTSGSTGTPKGVLVPHRAVLRLVRPASFMRLDSTVVFLHHSPASFDASTLEIWGPLLNGGRLVLFPPGPIDLIELGACIASQGVNAAWLTAALFRLIVDHQPQLLGPLEQLLTGGEVVPPDHVRRILERYPGLTVINGYGPTENTTFTTCRRMSSADLGTGLFDRPLPIGRPIGGTSVRVLDETGQRVPIGLPGELYAGGLGVALGYLGRADLTRERFVSLADEPGSGLWYRTGDLVRWRPDGELEFLGRVDRQVKISGFRIEPGEIETHLRALEGVRDACVGVDQGEGRPPRLVAWIVPGRDAPSALDTDRLRSLLAQRLPKQMVPASLILVDCLPMTRNGKIDFERLPAHGGRGPSDVPAPARPLSEREEQVWKLWTEVLGHDRFGLDDDFFRVGGDSLLALRISLGLERLTGRPFHADAFLTSPTVRGQAALLDPGDRPDRQNRPDLIRPGGEGSPVFLFPGIEGFVLSMYPLRDLIRPGHPVYGMPYTLCPVRGGELLSVGGMARRMIEAIDHVGEKRPPCLVGFSMGGHIVFEMARQLRAEGRPPASVVVLDALPHPNVHLAWLAIQVARRSLFTWMARSPQSRRRPRYYARELGHRLLHELTPDRFQRWYLARRHGRSPLGERAPAYRDLIAAFYRSRTGRYDGPITLIRGEHPEGRWTRLPADLHWGRFARSVDVHMLPARHTELLGPRHAPAIANVVNGLLAACDAVEAAREGLTE